MRRTTGMIPISAVLYFVPSKMVSRELYYRYLSPDETSAKKLPKEKAIDKETFDRLFKIRER